MNILNPNTPVSNFINTILTEKNKQIKENILLGNISFHNILFYSKEKEENSFKTPSHISFLNNLNRQKQLQEVREEKRNLEKKVNIVDNQLISIKYDNIVPNKLIYSEKYLNTNLNNNKANIKINSQKNSSHNSKSKNKSKKSSFSAKKSENINSLPTLGIENKKNKILKNIYLKPIQIKSYKSNSKVNNHEIEEKLEKNAKAFIQKLNKDKKNLLAMINKRQKKFAQKLKNEIEHREKENELKLDEYSKYYNIYNNKDYYNINSINNYSNLDRMRKEEKEKEYSPDNSLIRKHKNKKYYHYSPYNYRNPKMLKNISKDLLNFNSELYYNNNIPDIIQYQLILAPLYKNNNNIINQGRSTPFINIDDINNLQYNNSDNIDMTNGELVSNVSKINNYSCRIDESNFDNNNIIDNSYNKKHLYFFNEPKYELEFTSGDN